MYACIFTTRAAESLRSNALIHLGFSFSPRVEMIAPDTLVLDIDGVEHLFGSPHQLAETIRTRAAESGWTGNVAIAANMQTAIQAARGIDGITVISPGDEANTLSNLPLRLLSADPDMEQTWKIWGLQSFGDLAALPENGIAERLGPEGARLHRIARGAEDHPLIPFVPLREFQAAMELEHAVELLDPLTFILASLLNPVCAGLEARGFAAGEIAIRLRLQISPGNPASDYERRLRLPVPLRDSATLLKLLLLDLESHPPQAPVIAVSLRAEPASPRTAQHGLFLPPAPAPEPEKLELTLARILKLVGAENAGSPELADTHRPDAFHMLPFRVLSSPRAESSMGETNRAASQRFHPLSFRVFRPALAAQLQWPSEKPAPVRARGIRGTIVSWTGPWKTSGDWWASDCWDCEEWDVEVEPSSQKSFTGRKFQSSFAIVTAAHANTGIYRMHRDVITGSWCMDGGYD